MGSQELLKAWVLLKAALCLAFTPGANQGCVLAVAGPTGVVWAWAVADVASRLDPEVG